MLRILRVFRLLMLFGRHRRFLQFVKISSVMRVIFFPNSGSLSILEQSERNSIFKENISNSFGKVFRSTHPIKLNIMSFLCFLIDWCTSTSFGQSLRYNSSRFGTPEIFGVWRKSLELLKSITFSFPKH